MHVFIDFHHRSQTATTDAPHRLQGELAVLSGFSVFHVQGVFNPFQHFSGPPHMAGRAQADADDGFAANGTSNNIITMNATTTGGLLGSEVNLRSVVGVGWVVYGNVLGTNATGATPFSG